MASEARLLDTMDFDQWFQTNLMHSANKWHITFALVMWTIWTHGNQVVFSAKQFLAQEIWHQVSLVQQEVVACTTQLFPHLARHVSQCLSGYFGWVDPSP